MIKVTKSRLLGNDIAEASIEEMWERICDANDTEGVVEFGVRGNEVVLRNEHGFELARSYVYVLGYLHGRIDGEAL